MSAWPHDDTASLTRFYGAPNTPSNMVLVVPPWPITYEGRHCRGVQIHRKCAASLKAVFDDIAEQVGHDWRKLPAGCTKFSGSFNPRPVRGSSRPSCHAFGAAIDWDAEDNPMNRSGNRGTMSHIVVDAFKRQGWYWGGDFHSRQDPMHFQAAHEGAVTHTPPVSHPKPKPHVEKPHVEETPPHEEADEPAAEDPKPQATIHELPHPAPEQPPEQPHSELDETIQNLPKSILKSKIGWAQTVLAFFGIGSVGSQVDASFFDKAKAFVTSPGFMLLVVLTCVGLTIYWRWRDHGRGQAQ